MTFENARWFLYRVLPWAPVGDPTAVMNVHWTFQGDGYEKAAWTGRACVSIDECIRTVTSAQKMKGFRDVYVCMSSQREYEERAWAGGRGTYKKAIREQSNAVHIRSLWLDIDVAFGDSHALNGYPSQKELIEALVAFIKAAGLPRPTFTVDTGSGGLHVYWTMNEGLKREEWQPLANALAEACRRFKFRCDTSVTVDSARVLRLVDTVHSKTGKVARVFGTPLEYDYAVDDMRQALAPYMGAQVVELTPRGTASGLNSELGGGIETPQAAPVDLRAVAAAGCGFIGNALKDGGASYDQPLWNLTTLNAVFAEDARAMAHEMSKGHATYTQQDTDALFDRKQREQKEKNLGWPSCASVENAGCGSCRSCPLKGPGTRPLQFGRSSPSTPSTAIPGPVADLPHGYSRNARGAITKVETNHKDGTSRLVEVCPYPAEKAWVQDDPWTIHFRTVLAHGAAPKQVSLTVAQINSNEGFARAIGQQGMAVNNDQQKLLKEFIVSWTRKLQDTKDMVISASPFGWSVQNGQVDGFCYAGRVWTTAADRPAATPNPAMEIMYTPRGNVQPWIDAAKMVTDRRSPARDVYIASAFAAPLVRFTGLAGLLISTYSPESGVGKSTALKIAAAVWGSPQKSLQQLNDTQNSVFGKIGALQALPLYWDELKTERDTTNFVNIAFQLSLGKEKSRMSAEAQLRDVGTWQTLLVSASNDSLLDTVIRATKTNTGGIYRLFEYAIPPAGSGITASAANQVLLKLNDNFGEPGLLYAKFLGAEHARVHREVAYRQEHYEKTLKSQADERFWIGTLTVLVQGAMYANEIGLTDIDVPALETFLIETIERLRRQAKDMPVNMQDSMNISNVLQQYISAHRTRHVLYTDRIHTSPGKPPANSVKLLGDWSKIDGVYVHVGLNNRLMRMSKTHFRGWLTDMGYSAHAVMEAMTTKWKVKTVNGKIAGGTTLAGFTEYLLELDLSEPELSKFIELN